MEHKDLVMPGIVLVSAMLSGCSLNHGTAPTLEGQDVPITRTAQIPVYKPPVVGAPHARIGDGPRGPDLPILSALAPDHVGFTINPMPAIYWYLSMATTDPMEFTLTEIQAIQPVLRTRLNEANRPGIQRLQKPGSEVQIVAQLLPAFDRAILAASHVFYRTTGQAPVFGAAF